MIVATITSWDVKFIRWVHTLKQTGYTGRIAVFADKFPKEIMDKLASTYGIELYPVDISPEKWCLPVNKLQWRWNLYAQLCNTNDEDIIFTDCFDVIFRSNPQQTFERITVSSEGINFNEDQTGINKGWMTAIPATKLPDGWADRPIFNGGIVGGKCKDIAKLCQAVCSIPTGSDQASLNVALTGFEFNINEQWLNCNSNFNKMNEIKPSIVHANGDGYKSWIDQNYPPKNYEIITNRMMQGKPLSECLKPTLATYIPTKGRSNSTLPLTISSIIKSTYKPDMLIVVDDNKENGFPKTLEYLITEAKAKGINFILMKGKGIGQVAIHDDMRKTSFTDYIHRIDDDCTVEPNTIDKLISNFSDGVGAVSCSIIDPLNPTAFNNIADGTMQNIYWMPNIQWSARKPELLSVEHLYSSFIYRRGLPVSYATDLSIVGHREESRFSHDIFRAGYQLLVDTGVFIWHYRYPQGGIRQETNGDMFASDEKKFQEWAKSNKIEFKQPLFIQSCHALGDNYALIGIMPEIIAKHSDKTIVVGTGFTEEWTKEKFPIKIIDPNTFLQMVGQDYFNRASIYNHLGTLSKFGYDCHIKEAFEIMYGLKPIPQIVIDKQKEIKNV